MNNTQLKKSAAILSICSNALLIILKLVVGFIIGSLSIISEAFHSVSDIAASLIAFISVKKSSEPADKEHPFGHGKFEELSGFFEGLLICGISIFIFHSAIMKLSEDTPAEFEPFYGILIMGFSVILNICVSRFLFSVGKKTNSIAIVADAEHLKTDVISSGAVLLGLLIIKITGLNIIDVIFAFIVAIIIMITGVKLTLTAIRGLLDEALPQEDIDLLNEILNSHKNKDIVEVKLLKTRKSGSEKIIDIVITVKHDMTIVVGHEICNQIENEIISKLQGAKVFIHLEPAEK